MDALARLKVESAILDGEVVALKDGLSDFHELRRQLCAIEPDIITSSIRRSTGEDLRPLPYLARKNQLRKLIGGASKRLQYVDYFQVAAKTMWNSACKLHPGIVSKRIDAPLFDDAFVKYGASRIAGSGRAEKRQRHRNL